MTEAKELPGKKFNSNPGGGIVPDEDWRGKVEGLGVWVVGNCQVRNMQGKTQEHAATK